MTEKVEWELLSPGVNASGLDVLTSPQPIVERMKVPGGWIYQFGMGGGWKMVYVPDPRLFGTKASTFPRDSYDD